MDVSVPMEATNPANNHGTTPTDLHVRKICGYVAVRASGKQQPWLYLRKHSQKELFIGNMPIPDWFNTDILAAQYAAEKQHDRMKQIIHRMVPGAAQVGEVFSTGNNRLAVRIVMQNEENGVEEVLESPSDHLYVQWNPLEPHESPNASGVVQTWLTDFQEGRSERRVSEWANAAMKAYEAREKEQEALKNKRSKQAAVPDEDGFVTVTSGAKQMKAEEAQNVGVKGRVGRGHYKSRSGKNRKSLLDTSKGIEKSGFYRWQRKNKNTIEDLQKKFKEDQKRVAAIRGLEEGK